MGGRKEASITLLFDPDKYDDWSFRQLLEARLEELGFSDVHDAYRATRSTVGCYDCLTFHTQPIDSGLNFQRYTKERGVNLKRLGKGTYLVK